MTDPEEKPEWRIELSPEFAKLLETPLTDPSQLDGKTYLTGWRFNYQHCIECGDADSRGQASYGDTTVSRCHLSLLCRGIVMVEPWTGRTSGQRAYACCRGVAGRFLREDAWMPPTVRG